MPTDPHDVCLNCGRGEAEVPLTTWRYQGGGLVICSDCLPNLIHKRTQLMARWASADSSAPQPGDEDAGHS